MPFERVPSRIPAALARRLHSFSWGRVGGPVRTRVPRGQESRRRAHGEPPISHAAAVLDGLVAGPVPAQLAHVQLLAQAVRPDLQVVGAFVAGHGGGAPRGRVRTRKRGAAPWRRCGTRGCAASSRGGAGSRPWWRWGGPSPCRCIRVAGRACTSAGSRCSPSV